MGRFRMSNNAFKNAMTSAERLQRIRLLTDQARLLKMATSAGDGLGRYYDVLRELDRVQRIEAGYHDIMVFAKTYFTTVEPHDLLKPDTPSPPFHYELADKLREILTDTTRERKLAIAAPRGHAKSTIANNILSIWAIMYVHDIGERYIVIAGDKQEAGKRFLDVVKSEIEDNEVLKADFGALRGDVWNAMEIVLANDVKITAVGSGEAVRGLRYGSFRPGIIICDDIENETTTATVAQIQKTMDWLDKVILPLGHGKTKFLLIGTILTYNSVLNSVLNNRGDWDCFRYQALQAWPERMDMWNEFTEIISERTDGDTPQQAARNAYERALAYYNENADEMAIGADVLWPERISLLELFIKRAVSRLAFLTEWMNDPLDDDSRTFQKIWYYGEHELDESSMDYYMGVDPSLGKTARADNSVIVIVGRHRNTGICYVIEVDARVRSTDKIIDAVIEKATRYNFTAMSMESVFFQKLLMDQVIERAAKQGMTLPMREFGSKIKKTVRIASLEPMVTGGQIRFHHTQLQMLTEMQTFPKGSDDRLDALHQVMELTRKTSKLIYGAI